MLTRSLFRHLIKDQGTQKFKILSKFQRHLIGTYNFFESPFFPTQMYSCTRTASSLETEAGAVGGNGLDSQLYKRVDSIHDTFTTTEALHFRNWTFAAHKNAQTLVAYQCHFKIPICIYILGIFQGMPCHAAEFQVFK